MSEAEEAFREAAAVGNLAAARVYITNGININAQNRMNGWTALHWACSRGRKDMAQLLLMNGASVVITSSSGQTPIDVAKGAALTLFDQPSGSNQADSEAPTASVTAAKADESLDQDEDASEPATFVPAYLRYPDLSKVWTVPGSGDLGLEKPSQEANAAAAAVDSKPDDAMKQATPVSHEPPTNDTHVDTVIVSMPEPADTDRHRTNTHRHHGHHHDRHHEHGHRSHTRGHRRHAENAIPAASDDDKHEVLVYYSRRSTSTLLGAIFIDAEATIRDVHRQIKSELDSVPAEFGLLRHDGEQAIRIHGGQGKQNALMHLAATALKRSGSITPGICAIIVAPIQPDE